MGKLKILLGIPLVTDGLLVEYV